jgi:hypothetical protein
LVGRHLGGFGLPFRLAGRRSLGPGRRRFPALQRCAEFGQPFRRIGDQRQCPVLAGIEGLHVEPDDGLAGILEQRPRAGGEILQPRADGQHDVGVFCQPVGGGRAGDADRPHVERMGIRQRRLAALRFGDRNAAARRELGRAFEAWE